MGLPTTECFYKLYFKCDCNIRVLPNKKLIWVASPLFLENTILQQCCIFVDRPTVVDRGGEWNYILPACVTCCLCNVFNSFIWLVIFLGTLAALQNLIFFVFRYP